MLVKILLLFFVVVEIATASPKHDADKVFKDLDNRTQTIKLRLLDFNREASMYVAASNSALSSKFKKRQRADFTFDYVLRDYKNKAYLKAINRYHNGRDLGVIISKYELALRVANIYLDYGLYDYSSRIVNSLLGHEDSAVASLARFYLAKHNYKKHYWDEALKGFESVSDGLPDDLMDQNRIYQGIIYQQQKKHKAAINVFGQVPETSEAYVYAQFNIAMSTLRQGWWSDAENNISRILNKISGDSVLKRNLSDRLYIAAGYAQLQRKYYREAQRSLSHVSQGGAYTYKASLGLGLIAAEQGEYDKALQIMNQLISTYSQQLVTEEANVVVPFLLESIASVEKTADYYAKAMQYFKNVIEEINLVLPGLEQGLYDKEFIASAEYEAGYVSSVASLRRGKLNRYLFDLLSVGRWQAASQNFQDVKELQQLLGVWQQTLSVVGPYRRKAYKKYNALILKYQQQLGRLERDYTAYLRHAIKAKLLLRRDYFSSYLNQSSFALARNYDDALGVKISVTLGAQVIDEEKVRQAYRNYLALSQKTAINRRSALARLAELEIDYYDQLMADERPENNNKDRAIKQLDSSIALMKTALKDYPKHKDNDHLLYQLIKAYDKKSDNKNVLLAMRELVDNYAQSRFFTEIQFKLGEKYLTGNESIDAELAYSAALRRGDDGSVFYQRALYKRAWSRLRQSLYEDALEDFFDVLRLSDFGEHRKMTAAENTLYDDILRGLSLIFINQGGLESLVSYFKRMRKSPYASAVFRKLGDTYLGQQRNQDAVAVYEAFVDNFPDSPHAPLFVVNVIETWSNNGLRDYELKARIKLDENYAPGSKFWTKNDIRKYPNINDALKANILYMTSYYHSRYQHTKESDALALAKNWYERYFRFFSNQKESANTHFLYAELLSDAGELSAALQHYDQASSTITRDKQSAEAAYARIVTVNTLSQQQKTKNRLDEALFRKKVSYTIDFAKKYPDDKRLPGALLHILEGLFNRKQYQQSLDTAMLFPTSADKVLRDKVVVIEAHSQFALKNYKAAEALYAKLKNNIPAVFDKKNNISESLASAIYKQGELAEKNNDIPSAIKLYLRASESAPESAVAPIAQFDAANLLIKNQSFVSAIELLETFKQKYPNNKLQSQVSKKLAVLYLKEDHREKSAMALENFAKSGDSVREERRDALWQAAELYQSVDNDEKARFLFSQYVLEYPQPLAPAMEARINLVALYGNIGDIKSQNHWRQSIVDAEKRAGNNTTARAQYLAAISALQLAVEFHEIFENIKLVRPLKESLRKKKTAMRSAINSLERVNHYAIEKTSTEATFRIAEIYNAFSKALINSPRPRGLQGLELEQYTLLLEEQAFPFEEKAIEYYKSNTTLVKTGTFDEWVGKSFKHLSVLLPSRYGKQEKLEAFIELPAKVYSSNIGFLKK